MKKNVSRIICLLLVAMMAFTVLTACGCKSKTTTSASGDASTVVEENVELIENVDGIKVNDASKVQFVTEGGVEKMLVLEGTALKDLKVAVSAQEGYSYKLFNAESKEVTDDATVIVSGMKFKIFKGDTETKVFEIKVESSEQMAKTVEAAKKNAEKKKTESKSAETKSDSGTPQKTSSLKGYALKIGTIYPQNYTSSEATAKSNQAQIEKIKKKYGCTVDFIDYSGEYSEVIAKEVAAGATRADIIEIDLGVSRKLARQKVLANWAESSTLDIGGVFANAATKANTYNGKCFGVSFNSMAADNVMGVLFNVDLVKQWGGGMDVYSLYKNNQWTSENFKTLSENIFSKSGGKVFGFSSNTNIIGMAMTSFAGGTALMGGNGRVEATLCSQNSIDSMKWCKELYNNGKGSWYYNADIQNALVKFSNKESAMFVSYLSYYAQIASSGNFKMGFVPMPMDSRQGKYISGTYNGRYFVCPNTSVCKGNMNVYGEFLNEFAAVSTAQINNYKNSMRRNGLDSTATTIYGDIVNKYIVPEYSSGPFSSDFSAKVDAAVMMPSKDPKSVMEGLKSEAQAALDDFYNPLY